MDSTNRTLLELVEESLGEKDQNTYVSKIAEISRRLTDNLQKGSSDGVLHDASKLHEKFRDPLFQETLLVLLNRNTKMYNDRENKMRELFELHIEPQTHLKEQRVIEEMREAFTTLSDYFRIPAEDAQGMVDSNEYLTSLVAAYIAAYKKKKMIRGYWWLVGTVSENIKQFTDNFFSGSVQKVHKEYLNKKNENLQNETHKNTEWITEEFERNKDPLTDAILQTVPSNPSNLKQIATGVLGKDEFWDALVSKYNNDFTRLPDEKRSQNARKTVLENVSIFLSERTSEIARYVRILQDLVKNIHEHTDPTQHTSHIIQKTLQPVSDTLQPKEKEKTYSLPLDQYFVIQGGSPVANITPHIDRAKLRTLRVQDQANRDLPEGAVTIDITTNPPVLKVNHSLLPTDIHKLTVTLPVQVDGTYNTDAFGEVAFSQSATPPFVIEFGGVDKERVDEQVALDETRDILSGHMKGWGVSEDHIITLLGNTRFLDELVVAYQDDDKKFGSNRSNGAFGNKVIQYSQSHGKLKVLFEKAKQKLQEIKKQSDINANTEGVYLISPPPAPYVLEGIVKGSGDKHIPLEIVGRIFQNAPTTRVHIHSAMADGGFTHLVKVTSLNGTTLDKDCWRIDATVNPPELILNQNSTYMPELLDGVKVEVPLVLDLVYTDPDYGRFSSKVTHTLQDTIKFTKLDEVDLKRQLKGAPIEAEMKTKLSSMGWSDTQITALLANTVFENDFVTAFKDDYALLLQGGPGDTLENTVRKILGQSSGKVYGLMEVLKKKHDLMKQETLLTNNVSGVYKVTPKTIETTGKVVGSVTTPLDITHRVYISAPSTKVAIGSIHENARSTHLIKVTDLQGNELEKNLYSIVRNANSPEIVMKRDEPDMPDLLDGVKIEMPLDLNLSYTDDTYGTIACVVNDTYQDTIKFTDLDNAVVENVLGGSRPSIDARLTSFGRTDDQVEELWNNGPMLLRLVTAFKEDYKLLLQRSSHITDDANGLLSKFMNQSGGKTAQIFSELQAIAKLFLEQTNLAVNTSDLYKQKTSAFTTPLTPGRTQTFPLDVTAHLFQRTTGAKVALSGVNMLYNRALEDQLKCVDQSGKEIAFASGVYTVNTHAHPFEIQVDHDAVPPGTTSLVFTIPVRIEGIYTHTVYGAVPFEKTERIEQIVAFKGVPTRIFHQYFKDTVDGGETMRLMHLRPEQLADQVIKQANGMFASKLSGPLAAEDAELLEKCLLCEIDDFRSLTPHVVLGNDATVVELLVYELLRENSLEVNDIKEVNAVLEGLHQDPKKLFDSLAILQRMYALYDEFKNHIYRPRRIPLPTSHGPLPLPPTTGGGGGFWNGVSRLFNNAFFGGKISPNDYPPYAYLKGRGDEHGDTKTVENQSLRGTGVTYNDVSYTINVQHPGSVDFDLTIPEQSGRPEYVFNGSPGSVEDIRQQIVDDFAYPVDSPDRRLFYTVQLLFEREMAIRLTKQLGLLATTVGGETLILDVEGTEGNEELVLRRRGPGSRNSREMRRFRDLESDIDRGDFVDMIQEVMNNSVSQHRSLMLTNSMQTNTSSDYLQTNDHFPTFKNISGVRWGKKLEIDEDVWTFGPDKITVSYKDGKLIIHDEKNTYGKEYENMAELLLDVNTQSYALDFMAKFHEKYIEYMMEARKVNEKYVYLVRDPLSGYMIGMQRQNGRMTYGYVTEHMTTLTHPTLKEVRNRASLWTGYDNDFLCDAPITFDKGSEEVAKRAIMGRRELYYPLLQNMLHKSSGTNADAQYRREQMKEVGNKAVEVGKETASTIFSEFMKGFRGS